jgi:ABC-type phosphate transport system substrate-binding protein
MIKPYIIGVFFLSFIVAMNQNENNILENDKTVSNFADTVSKQEFKELITNRLIDPIRACLMEKDPHMFMTKCYTTLDIIIDGQDISEYSRRIYKKYEVSGEIEFVECGQKQHLCSFEAFVGADSVVVRDAFRNPWQNSDIYTRDFCKDILQND